MGFGDAVRTCWKKYGDFDGRAIRSEFWWWVLFVAHRRSDRPDHRPDHLPVRGIPAMARS